MTKKLFVLRTVSVGESDLIVHGLCERGKQLRLIARAAEKSKKRFGGGVLQPTHLIEAEISERSNSELQLLLEAKVINGFNHLRSSYEVLETALSLLKIVDFFAIEEENPSLFNLIGHAFTQLQGEAKADRVYLHFGARCLLFVRRTSR